MVLGRPLTEDLLQVELLKDDLYITMSSIFLVILGHRVKFWCQQMVTAKLHDKSSTPS
jgi:hypothetical protein